MKQAQVQNLTGTSALLRRWKVGVPIGLVVILFYVVGYRQTGAHWGAHLWVADLNPLPWVLGVMALGWYLRKYDQFRAAGGSAAQWSMAHVITYVVGVLCALVLWESPLNGLVPRSMSLYTVKLMGEFELAGPLLVVGIPFSLIDSARLTGVFWSILRFFHRPIVTATALAVILVLWDMADQMALGLRNALWFLILPGVYLALGAIVWMQSLRVFPLWPNFSNHFKKALYVWAMELAMMTMGAIWFWSAMSMGPIQGPHIVWNLSPLEDLHIAGLVMTGLSLPTMCLTIWHLWQAVEDRLRVPEGEGYEVGPISGQEG